MKWINFINPLFIIKILVYCMICVMALQTFLVQVPNREVYQAETKGKVTRTKSVYAERGQIMDRNGVVFADNLRDSAVSEDFSRLYLQSKLASQVIGKVKKNGTGGSGLENVFDQRLRGSEGFRVSLLRVNSDGRQGEIYGRSEKVADAEPGKNLVLTIDRNMQEIVEKELKAGVAEFKAVSASAVVVDPYTGEVLAMASYPTFDPNSKGDGTKNDIVAMSYEPGSTFKVITAAAALENGVVSPDSVFANEGKCWKWSEKSEKICDTHIYGDMDMAEAMVQSSNIVYGKIADKIGAEKLHRMARNFGFGMKTSDAFYGEESGKILQPYELTRDDRTLKTMGFGHALMATPIQLVMAYSAVANGGKLMEPMIVKEWRDSKGNLVEKKEPVEIRRVISEKTAADIRQMLHRVVNNGTAKKVMSKKIPDVVFGGKTGTAEKYNQETHKYDRDHQVASFIGLAPVENTRFVCMVLVDDPQTAQKHGGNTAGPIFRRIMEGIYYHPELSPASYNLVIVDSKKKCAADFVGMKADAAKALADSRNCQIQFEGKGNRVISARKDRSDSLGITLMLGEMVAGKMPDLKGLSLKDALEIAGNIRMNVEYTGKGRVVAQSPKADEELRKGQICKLTLKEKG